MASPLRAVIDASVAAKIFVPEALAAEAQALFARFAAEDGAELVVPGFFFVECASVFRKWVQRSAYPAKAAREHLRDLTAFGLTIVPTRVLASGALDIALKHQISAYDACYVAAAIELGLPLVTADEKLVRQFGKGAAKLRWLGDAA